MLHLIQPEQTWLFLYASLFFVVLFQVAFLGIKIQDTITLVALLLLSATQYGYIPQSDVITETILLFVSFALISHKYSKKLIFYLFSIAVYFTGIAISHVYHTEQFVLPAISLLLIFAIHKTHALIPNNPKLTNTKENTRFILILIIILQQLVEVQNLLFAWIYALFALYAIVRAFCVENKENQIFYGFFSFFLVAITYTLFSKVAVYYAVYLILYTTIAFFLFETARRFESKAFLLPIVFAMLHISHTVANPSFFLLRHIQTVGIVDSAFYAFSRFIYFIIFATVIKALHSFYISMPKGRLPWVPFIYILCAFIILIEAQVLHNILTHSTGVLYSAIGFSLILNIIYVSLAFAFLVAVNYGIVFLKKNYVFTIPSLPSIPPMPKFTFNTNRIFTIVKQNLNFTHSYTFFLIPIFLTFYLVISFYYS